MFPESMVQVVQLLQRLGIRFDLIAEQQLSYATPEDAGEHDSPQAIPPLEIVASSFTTILERAAAYDLIWTCSEFLVRALRSARSPVRTRPLIFTPARRTRKGAEIITEVLCEAHSGSRADLLALIPVLGRSDEVVADDDIGSYQHIRFVAAIAGQADLVVTTDPELAAKLQERGVSTLPLQSTPWDQALRSLAATTSTKSDASRDPSIAETKYAASESPIGQLLDDSLHTTVGLHRSDPTTAPVEIIVPIFNAPKETEECLRAVYAHTDRPFSLILIDDCSSDSATLRLLDDIHSWTRPATLRRLIVLRNSTNRGFAASVNRALTVTTSDVVLLNNDTLPPPAWLSRLESALSHATDIGSVTPWSNNGTICSIPLPCEVNAFPSAAAALEIQEVVRGFAAITPPTIPTGVGFCMLIARRALDRIGFFDSETFSPMYGEENDWCARAAEAGFRNVLAPNLYVPHHASASLSTLNDPNRAARIKHMVDLVDLFHPSYRQTIANFIELDPLRELRHLVELRRHAEHPDKLLEIAICNLRLGGGSHLFLENRLTQSDEDQQRYLLDISEPSFILLDRKLPKSLIALPKSLSNAKGLSALFQWLGIQKIFVNHLIGFSLAEAKALLVEGSIPYEIILHDYFAACPGITLLRYDNSYCGAELDPRRCNACLALGTATRSALPSNDRRLTIETWRSQFSEILAHAKTVHACSKEQTSLLNRYFPEQSFELVDFSYARSGSASFRGEFAFRSPITVAVIGAIGQHKGSDIIYWLEEAIRRRTLNIRLVVIGYTDRDQEPRTSHQGKFVITGRYAPAELPELLAHYETAVTLFPSIWPETFLLTLAEAQHAGYPAIVFDIGAPAARINAAGGGWIVPAPYGTEAFALLQDLASSPRKILAQAGILSRAPVA